MSSVAYGSDQSQCHDGANIRHPGVALRMLGVYQPPGSCRPHQCLGAWSPGQSDTQTGAPMLVLVNPPCDLPVVGTAAPPAQGLLQAFSKDGQPQWVSGDFNRTAGS